MGMIQFSSSLFFNYLFIITVLLLKIINNNYIICTVIHIIIGGQCPLPHPSANPLLFFPCKRATTNTTHNIVVVVVHQTYYS